MRLPRYKYSAIMEDKLGNTIEKIFDDTEKALQFARAHGYKIKAIRRSDYETRNSRLTEHGQMAFDVADVESK